MISDEELKEYNKRKKVVKDLLGKMKILRATSLDYHRWHLSHDLYMLLKEFGNIVCMNEGHETVKLCMGLPVTVHTELENHVSIE